jgi:hypothetical protein
MTLGDGVVPSQALWRPDGQQGQDAAEVTGGTAVFCLENAAADWLGDLRQSGSFEESDLEELGSHLEDEIQELMGHGLSEREAFWVAMSRVGNRNDLPGEYAKTNSRAVWRHRFWWMVAGILGYLGFNYLFRLLCYGGATAAASAGIDGTPLIVVSLSLMIVVSLGALLLAWGLVTKMTALGTARRHHGVRRSRTRTVVLYLFCVVASVVLIVLAWLGPFLIANLAFSSEASWATLVARDNFRVLVAVSLVSIVFMATRPRMSDPHLGLEG